MASGYPAPDCIPAYHSREEREVQAVSEHDTVMNDARIMVLALIHAWLALSHSAECTGVFCTCGVDDVIDEILLALGTGLADRAHSSLRKRELRWAADAALHPG